MTTKLNRKVTTCEPDDLVVGTTPPLRIGSAVVRKGAAALSLKRGTVMAKSSKDAKLVILGSEAADETLEAYGILADNIEVGIDEDYTAEIYIGGKFNSNKITVADGYTMSESDKDTLRKYGIEFTAALKY